MILYFIFIILQLLKIIYYYKSFESIFLDSIKETRTIMANRVHLLVLKYLKQRIFYLDLLTFLCRIILMNKIIISIRYVYGQT